MAESDDERPIDLEAAMLDPTTVFDDPTEVAAHAHLTVQQKRAILERWKRSAEARSASNEVTREEAERARGHLSRVELAEGLIDRPNPLD
ncbi:hypothetical protein C882_2608 [Caenispirillum salinarum AK4]|uniref:Uncharacterized protein n=1 Tax=Caenispirillum salinarum AK4 TaxID=1238182 RepID=K9H603_9PROT|nr:hypothetical protein [Caenispirillum salinarum]EKV32529.1 hypothetical protein C882_2608 [Caenispirillum salinarum AK4]